MVIVDYNGRLSNCIIQYIAASIFAEKFDLKLDFKDELNPIIKHISGNKVFITEPILVNEKNFLDLLSLDKINNSSYLFNGYFQLKDFFKKYEKEIKNRFLNFEKKSKEGFLIHIRLGDIIGFGDLSFDYYDNAIKIQLKNNITKGYIITDTPNNILISNIINKYPFIKIYHNNLYEDMKFGLFFNNIILSKGSYSFLIGYISEADNVYCELKNWSFFPNIYPDNWIEIKY